MSGSAQSLVDMLSDIKQYINPIVIIPSHGIIEEKLFELNIKFYVVPFPFGARMIDDAITKTEEELNYKDDYEVALKLLPIIESEKIQIIHSNSSVINAGAIAAIISNKPHVWHIRELLEEDFSQVFINEEIKKELLKNADAIISISNCVAQKYHDKYGIDTIMIHNGFNVERFIQPLEKENDERKNNTFLIAGRIYEGKGQEDVINAVDYLVNEQKESVQLIIAGGGDAKYVWCLKKYIEKKGLAKHIHIYPFQKDLSIFRRQCGYSITASRCEALGRVTIEAMLAGNIVIGANTGGTAEIIGTGQKRGFLYQQGDYLDLAKVMLSAIRLSNEEKMIIKNNAQKYVIEELNVHKYALKICGIYKSVLCEKRNKQKTNNELLEKLEEKYKNIGDESIAPQETNTMQGKFWRLFLRSDQWLHIRQTGHNVGEILLKGNINSVAIYGMGYLGRSLYDELEASGIFINYVIDRQPDEINKIFAVKDPEGELEVVDAIIVTVVEGEDVIINTLRNKCDYRIIGLSELLNAYEM